MLHCAHASHDNTIERMRLSGNQQLAEHSHAFESAPPVMHEEAPAHFTFACAMLHLRALLALLASLCVALWCALLLFWSSCQQPREWPARERQGAGRAAAGGAMAGGAAARLLGARGLQRAGKQLAGERRQSKSSRTSLITWVLIESLLGVVAAAGSPQAGVRGLAQKAPLLLS